ncbi:DUF4145 domain-containing protein [Brachyspira pilosicoli]|uniref:DUF4145 domain-containing protein n=1 Tax=Brachyspira pilosicoli TaxID=52584 RepID=UPI003006F35B
MINFSPCNVTYQVKSRAFVCWNCENNVASDSGLPSDNGHSPVLICPFCNAPNIIFPNGDNLVKPLYGRDIKKLPADIKNIYNEARKSMKVEAYTGAVMLLRKILMNVAVENKAEKGKTFQYYIDFLYNKGIIHVKQKLLTDKIRTIGNEANHQIESITKETAENVFKLTEHLLLNNYEFTDDDI